MKVFVYEHITSGALINESLPPSLAHEGNDMLSAIVDDMAQLFDIELIVLRDSRLEPLLNIINNPVHKCLTISNDSIFEQYYADSLRHADAVIIIAPESNGLLEYLQQSVINNGKLLLGCQPDATRICADKTLCHEHLILNTISTPHTVAASQWLVNHFNSQSGFIVKPRDGAGCIDTLFFPDQFTLEAWLSSTSIPLVQMIIQPYIEGHALSLTVLIDHNHSRVLAVNQQHIKTNNQQLSFHGCCVNGITDAQFSFLQASEITENIQRAIPGLWGFVGIDLIVSNNGAHVVDINPRLTTAYVGLHQSLNLNPAQLLLTMMKQGLSALPVYTERNAIEILI